MARRERKDSGDPRITKSYRIPRELDARLKRQATRRMLGENFIVTTALEAYVASLEAEEEHLNSK